MTPLIVKFTAKKYRPEQYELWSRQLPDSDRWGNCTFVFDQDCRRYDWLVVYDDLAPAGDERFSIRTELLACPREHALLLTSEPSSVKVYGTDYLDQFGLIVTAQEPSALRHPRAIYTQTGLRWFYGDGASPPRTWTQMMASAPDVKDRVISTLCSSKSNARTLQPQRIAFTESLQQGIPELDWFGKGFRPIVDKADALDRYAYHVAIENHIGAHYWSEKLADAFLGMTLPFYCGCPNVPDYFPEESVIPIDIDEVEGTIDIVRRAIANDEYGKRVTAIAESRRRVLEDYNLFAVLAREIERRHDPGRTASTGVTIHSRRAMRRSSGAAALRHGLEKLRARWRRRRSGPTQR